MYQNKVLSRTVRNEYFELEMATRTYCCKSSLVTMGCPGKKLDEKKNLHFLKDNHFELNYFSNIE